MANREFNMKNVMLIHQDEIQHYRVAVYNFLSAYLQKQNILLMVLSGGVQDGNPHTVKFNNKNVSMNLTNIVREIVRQNPDQIIFFVNPKRIYFFPVVLYAKFRRKKIIYWGHGTDLQDAGGIIKRGVYKFQHKIFDAIILYSEGLKVFINKKHYTKTFIANNTLNLNSYCNLDSFDNANVKRKYNITTDKNIVYVGRIQHRKRVGDLIEAYGRLGLEGVGLILVGPDPEELLKCVGGKNVYKLGAIYGEEVLKIISISDVYCMPGAVGLSIVEAFHFGLPFVTEEVKHGPEIMYLKDHENGFIVKVGDVAQLTKKLRLLLEDDSLRKRFSEAAKKEIRINGTIESFSQTFLQAISFVS
jgi:glycosyltransferase involved in cell wall biosynthesis